MNRLLVVALVLVFSGCKGEGQKTEGAVSPTSAVESAQVAVPETPMAGEKKDGKVEAPAGLTWVFSKPAGIEFSKTEVTVSQYRVCVEAGKCDAPKSKNDDKYCNWGYDDRGTHPVNCVDWNQATAFCQWAGGRLPTEDEWYAEASNKGTRQYPWGDQKATCDYAVMEQGGLGCGKDSTWPACSKERGNSVSGLCDMSGNVWEWTSSAWVVRGGSWYDDPSSLRASNGTYAPPYWFFNNGVRCGRVVDTSRKALDDSIYQDNGFHFGGQYQGRLLQVPKDFMWQNPEKAKKEGATIVDGFLCTLDLFEWDPRDRNENGKPLWLNGQSVQQGTVIHLEACILNLQEASKRNLSWGGWTAYGFSPSIQIAPANRPKSPLKLDLRQISSKDDQFLWIKNQKRKDHTRFNVPSKAFGNLAKVFSTLQPGDYTLTVLINFLRGKLRSNTVSFKIIERPTITNDK